MPTLTQIAERLDMTEEEATEAIQKQNPGKLAKFFGISEEDATQLIGYKLTDDEAGFAAYTKRINLVASLSSMGLMGQRSRG